MSLLCNYAASYLSSDQCEGGNTDSPFFSPPRKKNILQPISRKKNFISCFSFSLIAWQVRSPQGWLLGVALFWWERGCLGSFYRLIKKTSVSCFVKLILTLFLMDILFFALEVRFLALECRPDKDLLKINFFYYLKSIFYVF